MKYPIQNPNPVAHCGSTDSQGFYCPVSNEVVNQWKISHLLGQGTSGTVYLCTNWHTGEVGAIKFLRICRQTHATARFAESGKREIQILQMLGGDTCPRPLPPSAPSSAPAPASVPPSVHTPCSTSSGACFGVVKDSFNYHDHFCVVFECNGPMIGDLVRSLPFRMLPPPLLRQCCQHLAASTVRGVALIHEAGLVHADIKSENILLRRRLSPDLSSALLLAPPSGPGTPRPPAAPLTPEQASTLVQHLDTVIGDFGLSVHWTASRRHLICTSQYRAPEVFAVVRGDVGGGGGGFGGHRTASWGFEADIWALGCVVYEIFAGRLLFGRLTTNTDASTFFDQFFKNGSFESAINRVNDVEIRPILADFLRKALALQPSQRLSARSLLRHPLISSVNAPVPPPPPAPAPAPAPAPVLTSWSEVGHLPVPSVHFLQLMRTMLGFCASTLEAFSTSAGHAGERLRLGSYFKTVVQKRPLLQKLSLGPFSDVNSILMSDYWALVGMCGAIRGVLMAKPLLVSAYSDGKQILQTWAMAAI